MIRPNPATLYKSQKRGLNERKMHRLHATFNFENHHESSRMPFGTLTVFNDEILAPKQHIKRFPPKNSIVILLPMTGALQYSIGTGEDKLIIPGETATIPAADGELTLKNFYDDELINYLYIVFSGIPVSSGYNACHFDFNIHNTLHSCVFQDSIIGTIGIFDSGKKASYPMQDTINGLFVFVINGTFKVQGHLLEERDGLALWDTAEAGMEALSENAIILLFEMPLKGFNG